jgi:Calx-beta domain
MINLRIFLLAVVLLSFQLNAKPVAQVSIPQVSQQEVLEAVFNKIERKGKTIIVSNDAHRAEFSAQGIIFKPRRGPMWHWQLAGTSHAIQPVINGNAVDYIHGDYTERYLLKPHSIEQRFIIEQPYKTNHDLFIEGKIKSTGQFETAENGWLWRNPQGVVSLGQVTVFDAKGNILPASMQTRAQYSRIRVAASDLKTAVYPVIIDPEIGSNDILLSVSDGASGLVYRKPAISYNSANNEYFVVWEKRTSALSEIFGQRVNGATGALLGNAVRISDMGNGSPGYDAGNPAISYNATNNEYLVVWSGEDNSGELVKGEFEIYAQRVNAETAAEIGVDMRLSNMGTNDGDTAFSAVSPAVSYNITNNEYLVIWRGDDDTAPLIDNEFEVYAQRVNAATGASIGNATRLSDMGPDGNASFSARQLAIRYNITDNEYLVVWSGDDNSGALVDGEFEIFAQRINAASGAEIGVDIRLSDMGSDGDVAFGAFEPAVSYNVINNEYLVAWSGDDNSGALVDGEFEIFAQRINAASGAEIDGDIRLSDMGTNDGDSAFKAYTPAVSYNSSNNEYFVVWRADDDTAPLVDGEIEVFAQRLNAGNGAEIGGDIRLSDMGPNGVSNYTVFEPDVSYNATNNEYLAVWQGDEKTGSTFNTEFEIFAQRFAAPAVLRFVNASPSVSESAGSIQIEVQRAGDDSNNIVTVDFSSANGTAVSPSDYTTANGTLTFNAGVNSKIFTIAINDNQDIDGDKTINLSLSNLQSSLGGIALDLKRSSAIVTIVDDDAPAPVNTASGGGGGSVGISSLIALFLSVLAKFNIGRIKKLSSSP